MFLVRSLIYAGRIVCDEHYSNSLEKQKTCEEVKKLLVTYVAILRGLYSLIRHHFSSPIDNDTWVQASSSRNRRGKKTRQKFQVQCDSSHGYSIEELL